MKTQTPLSKNIFIQNWKRFLPKAVGAILSSHLQEVMQRKDGVTPRYVVIEEVGPDHDKIFTLGVYSGDRLISKGTGPSKQHAQQEAAKAALVEYGV